MICVFWDVSTRRAARAMEADAPKHVEPHGRVAHGQGAGADSATRVLEAHEAARPNHDLGKNNPVFIYRYIVNYAKNSTYTTYFFEAAC